MSKKGSEKKVEYSEPEMTKIPLDVSNLQKQIIDGFMAQIGEAQKNLSELDKAMVKQVATDAAKLQARSVLKGEDVSKEIKIVNATLLNLTVAAYMPVKTAFWNAVQNAATVLTSVLVKAAMASV